MSVNQGNQVGSSWDDAAALENLPQLLDQAQPGDEIWIRGDQGPYRLGDASLSLKHGGSDRAPVIIKGVAADGSNSSTPIIIGSRDPEWQPGKANGSELFRLLEGANHLRFENLDFEHVGNGVFRIGADITHLTIENISASNVRRFIENTHSGATESATATISGLRVKNVDIRGFSKGAIRLRYDSHDILLEDVFGDSERQDGDNFAMGVHLQGSVHDVVHRRVTMLNSTQTRSEEEYWNGDGFVTEADTYNITYEETYAAGNTDGGYDLKSKNTVLINTQAADNKRNYRLWGTAELRNIISEEPYKRGGIGAAAHLWTGKNAEVLVVEPQFIGVDTVENLIFEVEADSRLTINGGRITDNLYVLERTEEEAELTIKDLQENIAADTEG